MYRQGWYLIKGVDLMGMVGMGWQLGLMILMVFSNLNDSMVLWSQEKESLVAVGAAVIEAGQSFFFPPHILGNQKMCQASITYVKSTAHSEQCRKPETPTKTATDTVLCSSPPWRCIYPWREQHPKQQDSSHGLKAYWKWKNYFKKADLWPLLQQPFGDIALSPRQFILELYGLFTAASCPGEAEHWEPAEKVVLMVLVEDWQSSVKRTSSYPLVGTNLYGIQKFSHASTNNCPYPELISVSHWGFSPPPSSPNMLKAEVKRLHIHLISSSPGTCLYFSPISSVQGKRRREREKKKKETKKSSPWRIQFSRITLLLRPLRGSLPRTACGFQHNICSAPALCQLW